jgi:hypothetical protein
MTRSSTLDPDVMPGAAAPRPKGHDTRSLGPSDSSDSGSDVVGDTGLDPVILDDNGDSSGTGVDASPLESRSDDTDIGFDRVVGAAEAGLGGGDGSAGASDLDGGEPDGDPDGFDDRDPSASGEWLETVRTTSDEGPDKR